MTYIIPQKMSGTGTIHDIASQHYDREIQFPAAHRFAFVEAAYYGDDYSTYATLDEAVEAAISSSYSGIVIDSTGAEMWP